MGAATDRAGRRDGDGHLVIIGGGEDRKKDKRVLARFLELAGGADARIVVLTAASTVYDEMWEIYDQAFGDLGVGRRSHVVVADRDAACDEGLAARVFEADGIFMTGGDQKRLLALIGGTRIDNAMHRALREHGACIAGTSAGASAMSEHMLFDGSRELLPEKGSVHLAAGLGFVQRVVIDQHFSERQRLARLLTVVAQNPYLLGAGIDEDTALVIAPGHGIEVIGEGAVTVIDGREMKSNFLDVRNHERLELTNVKLHLLPAGSAYRLDDAPAPSRAEGAEAAGDGGRGDGGRDARQERHEGHDRHERPPTLPSALRDVVTAMCTLPERYAVPGDAPLSTTP